MVTIYVLKCTNNKYYIGKTMNDLIKRFNTHKKGQGAVWTRKYRPIKILESYKNCDHFDEDKYTKIYMDKYGIENVRGGSYTKINLDNSTINFLKKELSSIHDKCYGCGSKNHFAKDCTKKKISKKNSKKFYNEPIWKCEFCNKGFDSLKGCRFHENIHCTKRRRKKNKSFDSAHALFDELKDSSDEEYSDEEYLSDDYYYKQTNYTCFRCGRKGHMANNCFANKHIKGYNLGY